MLTFKTWFLKEEQTAIAQSPNPTQTQKELDKLVHHATMDPKVTDTATNVTGGNPKQVQSNVIKAVQTNMKNMPNNGNMSQSPLTAIDVANGVIKQIGGNVPQIGATAGFKSRQ